MDTTKIRQELLENLYGYQNMHITAQEDYDYAKQKIAEIRQQIKDLDTATPPAHVCCKCKRTDTSIPYFLGFHGYISNLEVCDYCAEIYGCACDCFSETKIDTTVILD